MPKQHRRKMCGNCAFNKVSIESQLGELEYKEGTLLGTMVYSGKPFWCHETMLQTNPGVSKWAGEFDEKHKCDGSSATMGDHLVCAGYAALLGEEMGLSKEERLAINIKGHLYEEQIKNGSY